MFKIYFLFSLHHLTASEPHRAIAEHSRLMYGCLSWLVRCRLRNYIQILSMWEQQPLCMGTKHL